MIWRIVITLFILNIRTSLSAICIHVLLKKKFHIHHRVFHIFKLVYLDKINSTAEVRKVKLQFERWTSLGHGLNNLVHLDVSNVVWLYFQQNLVIEQGYGSEIPIRYHLQLYFLFYKNILFSFVIQQ